ncbi:uncharacterized protein Dwil_GK19017 [Drosophila willistoni]|uniref:Uncharacterized protein n=1 Tax=Drosophila willistoni TaxID=7260 RepID=B4MWZ8_DROWI|nr:uncharacterized protein Dwil_GK19017 [Drosophila willistoni]
MCLLDTTCSNGPPFQYVVISSYDLQEANKCRLARKYPPLLSFDYNKAVCDSMNKKCGLNCCCRETCPQLFCSVGRK